MGKFADNVIVLYRGLYALVKELEMVMKILTAYTLTRAHDQNPRPGF